MRENSKIGEKSKTNSYEAQSSLSFQTQFLLVCTQIQSTIVNAIFSGLIPA